MDLVAPLEAMLPNSASPQLASYASPNYWHNDCIEFFYNTKGNANWGEAEFGSIASNGATKSIRVWAEQEGTDHYTAEGTYASTGTAGEVNNATKHDILKSYTLKYVDGGYNVELTLKRSELEVDTIFSFVGVVTFANDASTRIYGYSETSLCGAGNAAKDQLTQVEIVNLVED